MANALTSVVGAVRDPIHWRNLIADLAGKIAAAQARVEANEANRGRLALEAVGGEPKARRLLDRLNADRVGLDLELANLTHARLEAERQLLEAEGREKADSLWRERSAQRRDLKERSRIAREVDDRLQQLADDLRRIDALSERIRARHRSLGQPRILVDPLAADAIASRLGEYLHKLGVPEGTLGSEGSALRPSRKSYAEAENEAQCLYDPYQADEKGSAS